MDLADLPDINFDKYYDISLKKINFKGYCSIKFND